MTFLQDVLRILVPNLVVVLVTASIPLVTFQIKTPPIVIALGFGLLLSILGAIFSFGPYPWTSLLVLFVALTGGILLGRGMPVKTRPFLLLLAILSILDIIQFVLTSQGPGSIQIASVTLPPPPLRYLNFFLLLPWGHFNIGIFDIWILAAMAEQWRRQGRMLALVVLPGSIGMVLVFVFGETIYRGALPLIPFLTIGWLLSIWIAHSRKPGRD